MLKLIYLSFIGMFMVNCLFAQQDNFEKPNILLIMADDMGFSDIGCYGGEIQTPNLDRLADNGVRFKQFYNAARCCPTRASLLTGLYPHQTGIGHMTNTPTNPTQHNYGYPGYLGYLNQKCATIAEMLKSNNYSTLMCGKWHLGYHGTEKWPLQRGFDEFYGILAGAANYFNPEKPRGLMLGNDTIPPANDYYITDAFTDNAIQFLKNTDKEEKPFFLYLAFTSPHWPLHALKEDIDKYRGKYSNGWTKMRNARLKKMKKIGLLQSDVELSDQAGPEWSDFSEKEKTEMDLRMAIYAAQIDRMDQNIGKLINHLEKSGELDNTMIIFLSDNGACAEGGMLGGGKSENLESKKGFLLSYGEAWANASNTPFKMYKHWVHEGGISTPLIVHWPKGIPDSKNCKWIEQFAFLPDIAASIKEVTNTRYPKKYNGNKINKLVGQNIFSAILDDKPIHEKPVFWEHEGNCAVRDKDFKLVKKYLGEWELYNLKTDRAEAFNLIDKMPELANCLVKKFNTWKDKSNVIDWAVLQKTLQNH